MNTLEFIRKHYDVPAKRGQRVLYCAHGEQKCGTIVGAKAGYLRIRLDGETNVKNYHPTWMLTYL